MKKSYRFFVTVVMFALVASILGGCGKKREEKKPEKIIIQETEISPSSASTTTIETPEVTSPAQTQTPTTSTINAPEDPQHDFSYDYEASREFTQYWDYENNVFDLPGYLNSTNPSKELIIEIDSMFDKPSRYTAKYELWLVTMTTEGWIKVSRSGNSAKEYFYIDKGYGTEHEVHKTVYLDNFQHLETSIYYLPFLEPTITLVKKYGDQTTTVEAMKKVFYDHGFNTVNSPLERIGGQK